MRSLANSLLGGPLWGHHDFLKFWAGQSISAVGTYATLFALPTVAILTLDADSTEVGFLRALRMLPFPLLALLIGVYVDRHRRRPVMIVSDLIRTALVGAIPIAYWTGHLTLGLLYICAACLGIATVFFQLANRAYLPDLVARDEVQEGNHKLRVTENSAQVLSFSAMGAAMQALGPPIALAVDAVSFVASWASLLWIRKHEPERRRPNMAAGFLGVIAEVRDGLEVLARDRVILAITIALIALNFGTSMRDSVYLLFAYRTLHLSPGDMGFVFGFGSVAGLVGAVASAPIARKIGFGGTLVITAAMASIGLLAIPVAAAGASLLTLAVLQAVVAFQIPIFNINSASYTQVAVDGRLLGRIVSATMTVSFAAIPVGAAVGGVLGGLTGYPVVLITSGVVSMAGAALLLRKSILTMVRLPERHTVIPIDPELDPQPA